MEIVCNLTVKRKQTARSNERGKENKMKKHTFREETKKKECKEWKIESFACAMKTAKDGVYRRETS